MADAFKRRTPYFRSNLVELFTIHCFYLVYGVALE